MRVGARLGRIIKWGQGPLLIVRNLERLAGADIFEGIDTGLVLADISESTGRWKGLMATGSWLSVIWAGRIGPVIWRT